MKLYVLLTILLASNASAMEHAFSKETYDQLACTVLEHPTLGSSSQRLRLAKVLHPFYTQCTQVQIRKSKRKTELLAASQAEDSYANDALIRNIGELYVLYKACNNPTFSDEFYKRTLATIKGRQGIPYEQSELDLYLRKSCQHVSKLPLAHELILWGANVKQRINGQGDTILHSLIEWHEGWRSNGCNACGAYYEPQRESIIAFLIAHNASTLMPNGEGMTPLNKALRQGCNDQVTALLRTKENIFQDPCKTVYMAATQYDFHLGASWQPFLAYATYSDEQGITLCHYLFQHMLEHVDLRVWLSVLHAIKATWNAGASLEQPDKQGITASFLLKQAKSRLMQESNDKKNQLLTTNVIDHLLKNSNKRKAPE